MFFIGHSHVVALEGAADAMGLRYRSLNLWGFGRPVLYGDGPPRLDDQLELMLEGHALVVSAAGGSAHDMLGLAQHPQPFDLVLPEEPDLPLTSGARIVSHAAVDAAVRGLMEPEQLDLVRLLARPDRRVVHIEPPPVIGDDARLSAQLMDMPFVPPGSPGPSPPWLRYKLWRVHSAIVREACAAAGVVFAPAPAAAMADGRFLRPELYERPCHANAAYGALVLRDIGAAA